MSMETPMPTANIAHSNDNTHGQVRLDRVTTREFLKAADKARDSRRGGETLHDALVRAQADKLVEAEALLIKGVKPVAVAYHLGLPTWVVYRINHKLLFACACMLALS
jgi:hypothetical protein